MPKVTGGITAAIVAVLMLTGCANTAPTDADETPAETPAPLVAETPATAIADDADAAFLTYVREHLPTNTQIPDATDEQLIAAGQNACDQMRAGTAPGDVRVVDGEQPNDSGYYLDSSAIMNGAVTALCPEFLDG